MNAIEMLELTKKYADEYSEEAKASLVRNNHMNDIKDNEEIDQRLIDAVLVDFINFIGVKYGIDYALYGRRICARFNGAYTLLGVWFYFNF